MRIQDSLSLDYRSPVGESGIGVRAANDQNSVIRVYAHEVSHKAAARQAAEVQGVEVTSQRVEIRMTANEEGRVVAAGGETVSELENEDGRSMEVRELALLSGYSGGGSAGSAAFFGDSRRRMPQLFLFDAYGSRLYMEGALERLALNSERPLVERNLQMGAQHRDRARGLLDSLGDTLARLSGKVESLGGLEPYINLVPSTSSEGLVEARVTSSEAEAGTRSLRVASLARARQAGLDSVSDNTAALGLEGRFKLNGVEVHMVSSDTLIDLETLINRGEDANGNRRLDNAEDANWNRSLDPREDLNGNGVLDIDEDTDADGVLDSGEDVNINGRLDASEDRNYNFSLDGGTAAHGVKAFRIEGNILVMQAQKPDGLFEVDDGDGLLKSLGLITTDLLGDTVFAHEIFGGSKAVVEEGGETREFPSNDIKDYAPGLDLTLASHHQFPVELTLSRDVGQIMGAFSGFREAYNTVQGELNELAAPDGIFRDSLHVGAVKTDLTNALRFEKAPPPEVPAGLEDFGFRLSRQRVSLDEAAVRAADLRREGGKLSPFDGTFGAPTVRNSLGQFGLTGPGDATVEIEEALLSQRLEQNAQNAEEALGSSALMGRLRSSLESALEPFGGHLSMARASKGEPLPEGFFEKLRLDAALHSALGATLNLVA